MKRVVLALASGLLLLGGCAFDDPVAAPTSQIEPTTSASEAITPAGLDNDGVAAWEQWKQMELSSYTYELTVGCFCPSLLDAEVVVRDGEVVRLGGKPFKTGATVTGFRDATPTIDDVFTVLGYWQERADSVSVDYDSDTGVPTSIQVDSEENAVDDEIGYRVENVQPLESASNLP